MAEVVRAHKLAKLRSEVERTLEQVTQSRQRIVEAGVEARRRIERDLTRALSGRDALAVDAELAGRTAAGAGGVAGGGLSPPPQERSALRVEPGDDVGDLLMAQALDFEQSHHGAMLDRQFLHRIVQFFLKFPHVGAPVCP